MKIVLLDKPTLTVGDIDFSPIEKLGEVSYNGVVAPEQLRQVIGDAEAVLCNKAVLGAELIGSAKNLRYIGLFATGYNNIDLAAADKNGVSVANTPGYSTDSVAQHVFSLILNIAGSISKYDASVHSGDWVKSLTFSYFPYPITELCGKTLGIFGYGAIGKKVAKIADAFGMKVLVCTRTRPVDCIGELTDCDGLFSRSDYVTLHCPLTPQTAELVNRRTLGLMKKTAVLINTSRGGVVNEADLADALNRGQIAAAGVDVVTNEPMRDDNPLLKAANCVITPHTAWASKEARVRLISLVADNLAAFQAGSPVNIVNHPSFR